MVRFRVSRFLCSVFEASLISARTAVAHWSGRSDVWCAGRMSVSLADFSEPGFDCNQWVNTACSRFATINRSQAPLQTQIAVPTPRHTEAPDVVCKPKPCECP
jgi:hypothetical protein